MHYNPKFQVWMWIVVTTFVSMVGIGIKHWSIIRAGCVCGTHIVCASTFPRPNMQRECILLPSVFELCIFLVWSHHRGPRSRGCRTPWRSSNADGGAKRRRKPPMVGSLLFFSQIFLFSFWCGTFKIVPKHWRSFWNIRNCFLCNSSMNIWVIYGTI